MTQETNEPKLDLTGETEYKGSAPDSMHSLLPFSLGLTSMATQIILLREFLSLFYGNELVIGVVLSNWMLLTGLGAWLGKFSRLRNSCLAIILYSLVLLAIIAPVTLFAADGLKNLVFTSGSMIGLAEIFLTSMILLVPFCLLSGFLFTRLSSCLSAVWLSDTSAKVFAYESIGSMAGGMILNFILVFLLKPFQSLLIIFIINAGLASYIAYHSKLKKLIPVFSLFVVFLAAIVLLLHPDQVTRRMLFPGQEVKYFKDTPYGNLVVTRTAEQLNFFGNSSLLFTTNNITNNEESVHYALLQQPDPKNVLLVEGGISGSLKEITRYPVSHIRYVEMNPWIIRLGEKYTRELSDQRVRIYRGDARRFLRENATLFDAVLLQVPEPSTLLANRFYTLEFFTLVKTRMSPGAVLSLGLMPTPTYVGGEARQVQAVMLTTLKMVFEHVLIIPGEKNYFLASDKPLNIHVARLAKQRNIPTRYVNEYYLDDEIIQQRSREIMKTVSIEAEVNRDFKPVAYFAQLQYWLSYFGQPVQIIMVVLLLLLLAWVIRANPVRLGIMTTGFTASSLEILLLFVFQVIFGYLYLMIGVIIMVFMGGLYIGAIAGKKILPNPGYKNLVHLQASMVLLCLAALGVVVVFRNFSLAPWTIHAVIFILILITAILAGIQFQWSARVLAGSSQTVSGSLYSADLLGSAAGTLLVSAWLAPILGIQASLWFIAALNLVAGGWMLVRRKKVILV